MINIQLKTCNFSNSILNDDCSRHLHIVADDINPNRSDRYWIMVNPDTQIFTYGTKNQHDSADVPRSFHGLDVVPQIRTGGITYHGPGQLTWVGILNYRRLLRMTRNDIVNVNTIIEYLAQALNEEFNENLESHPADPGLYRPSGEKILSYGIDLPSMSWIAIKFSLNLHVDLSVYDGTTICGVENRAMGNLLPSLPDLETQRSIGHALTNRLLNLIYQEYQIVPWSE